MDENIGLRKVIPMPVGQLIALRNLKNGVTVLTPDFSDSRNYLEFQAAGDPSGGDLQYVSEKLTTTPAVVKALQHGVLALETDTMSPDVKAAFDQQMMVARQQRERAEAAVAASIDRPENRDIVGETCIGPGERDGSPCGASIAMRDRAQMDTAPLCARHSHLAMEYTRTENNSYNPDGTSSKGYTWFRTRIDPRERSNR